MRRRIIIKNVPGREMSRATRERARGHVTREQKRIAKLGRVGMFEFEFALVKDQAGPGKSTKIIKEISISVDSYDEAVEYARIHTPPGHQGLIDGTSVVFK